jgi:hypothetical protein
MKDNLNEIVLRPRFKFEIDSNHESVVSAFEKKKSQQDDFIVTRVDDHVFIKLPKEKQHFWSPQLHIEINEKDSNTSLLYGLFGPNPTVWTLFMFFHFMVGGLFIAAAIWSYSNWALKTSYAIQVSLMLLMVLIWFTLYFIGRIGKGSSKNEMHALHVFMNKTLEEQKLKSYNPI